MSIASYWNGRREMETKEGDDFNDESAEQCEDCNCVSCIE